MALCGPVLLILGESICRQNGQVDHAHDALRFVEIPCSFGFGMIWPYSRRISYVAGRASGSTARWYDTEVHPNFSMFTIKQKPWALDGTLVRRLPTVG